MTVDLTVTDLDTRLSATATFTCEPLDWTVTMHVNPASGRETLARLTSKPAAYARAGAGYWQEPYTSGQFEGCLPSCAFPSVRFICADDYVGIAHIWGETDAPDGSQQSTSIEFECTDP